ncbi:MAG: hypothetical protein RPT95_08995 [Candidatus Sedimenticola sp. (ex Thyasira tokunagai)]
MPPNSLLSELLGRFQALGESSLLIGFDEVQCWPEGALNTLLETGLIAPASPAKTTICKRCEEECSMRVRIIPGDHPRAFIMCEEHGREPVDLKELQQWQLTQGQLARWIADTLSLRFSGKRLDGGKLLELGLVSGKKRAQMLCLHTDGELALVAGSNRIPLVDAVQLIDEASSLDADLIRQLVDSTTGDARHTPNTARREVRKLETAAIHEQWRKEYRALKKKRPNMSDIWYSQQIAKMECANGKQPETIRRQMKK